MKDLEQTNENKTFMKSSYNDTKMDKSNELNESMTLNEGSRDEYEKTLHNLGGGNNA